MQMAKTDRYPALDGIRGIAVLMVMFSHGVKRHFPLGGVGVDIFFVLSGFLITALLVREYDKYGSIILKNFYMRRFLRLMPCLWIVVGAFLLLSLFFQTEANPVRSAVVTLLYLMNWTRAFKGSELELFGHTFQLGHDSGWLGHTWSLGVEEQFYLIWPFCILLICRFVRSNKNRAIILFVAFIGLTLYRMHVLPVWSLLRTYDGLDTRANGLVLGSCLALVNLAGQVNFSGYRRFIPYLTPFALLALVLIGHFQDQLDLYILGVDVRLISILCGAILIYDCVAERTTLVTRILSNRILCFCGTISYGLYLWHYPIYKGLRLTGIFVTDTWQILVAGGALSLVAASSSYFLVENRFLDMKTKWTRKVERSGPAPPT